MPRTFRRAKLAQRLGFDLPDALTGDVESLTDLFQSVLALAADAEAQPDHFFFFRRQGLQNISGLIAHVGVDYRIHRRSRSLPECARARSRCRSAAGSLFLLSETGSSKY